VRTDDEKRMGDAALNKAGRRLPPVMAACYFFAYLARAYSSSAACSSTCRAT
jgi:hypothetical protein